MHIPTLLISSYTTCNYLKGPKYLYKEDWGENLVDKAQPVICVLDLTSGEVTVLEKEELADVSCGQVCML